MRSTIALAVVLVFAADLLAQTPQNLFDPLGKEHIRPQSSVTGRPVLGDLDGDGDVDLVMAGGAFLNDGQAVFTQAAATRLPVWPLSVGQMHLGDVDGDRDLDLIVPGRGGQDQLWLNDGTGRFSDATAGRLPPDSDYSAIARFADVDRDGDLDLLFGNGQMLQPAQDRLLINDGRGRFTDETVLRLPAVLDATWLLLHFFDCDGDGDLDLLKGEGTAYPSQVHLLVNDGAGRFADQSSRLPSTSFFASGTTADLDGDRDLDIVLGAPGRARLFLNDGKGVFTDDSAARIPGTEQSLGSVLAFDADRDGWVDLVFSSGPLAFYRNIGNGYFRLAPERVPPFGASDLAAADLDGDGDLDVAGTYGNQPTILLSAERLGSRGWFEDAQPPLTVFPRPLAVADFDGDGNADVLSFPYVKPELHLGDGFGRWTDVSATHMPALAGSVPVQAAIGDFDRDGDVDVFFTGRASLPTYPAQHRLLVNDGRGRFADLSAIWLPPTNPDGDSVAAGDIDGDGDLDAVVAEATGVSFYINDRSRLTPDTGRRLSQTGLVHLLDVDGDRDLDLLLLDYFGTARLMRNDGRGYYADVTRTHLPPNSGTFRATAADVDGDGDLDLALAGGSGWLYLNDGTGRFSDVSKRLPPATQIAEIWFVDLDESGGADLVVYESDQSTRVWLGDGRGGFRDGTAGRLPLSGLPLLVPPFADLDGDGDIDCFGGQAHWNLRRHLHTPLLPRLGRPFQIDLFADAGVATQPQLAIPLYGLQARRLNLPPYGRLGIDPSAMIVGQLAVVLPPAGKTSLTFTLPVAPALNGLTLHVQGFFVRDLSKPGRLSNITADRIVL